MGREKGGAGEGKVGGGGGKRMWGGIMKGGMGWEVSGA